MAFNLTAFLAKVPAVVTGIVGIIEKVRGASPADKVDASVQAVLDSVSLAEFAIGMDAFNDANIRALLQALVEAEHAVLAARDALKAGLLSRQPHA